MTVTAETIVILIRAVREGKHAIDQAEAVSLIEQYASVSASMARIEATEEAYERSIGILDATIGKPIYGHSDGAFYGERAAPVTPQEREGS